MNSKLQWLRNKMLSMNLQGIIISNPVNIKYLTNIDAEGELLLTLKENIFLTDSRYIEEVQTTITLLDEIIVYDVRSITKDDYENFFMFCENVGFEEQYISYYKYKEYIRKYRINNFVETEKIIEKQRTIKTEEEIKNIIKACEVTDNCFAHILSYIKPGMTEIEISNEIKKYFRQNSHGRSFEPIVLSGENTSKPHGKSTDRKIQENDIIMIDMGCKINGYCSDMTRTFFVGNVPDNMKRVYNLVLKNQIQTSEQMKDGMNTKLLSKMVSNDFKLNRFDLIHSIGHGVGLQIHESPFVSENSEMILKENMIVTNEPGIYVYGKFGIRIEDTVQITKFGSINLTKSEKNYIVI